MGRRGVGVGDERRWIFNRLAADYAGRPPYPAALIDRLAELARGGRVLDVGAGIGHLAIPLARRGLEVTAVEPARAMLDALASRARGEGCAVEAVRAAAEETGLPSARFSLAVLADAAHWVDPPRAGAELHRVLAPGGICAIVEVELGGSPFMDALLELIAAANPRRRPVKTGGPREVLALATGGAPISEQRLRDAPPLSPEQLAPAVRSLSLVRSGLPDASVQRLAGDAVALARTWGGAVWARTLVLRWAELR